LKTMLLIELDLIEYAQCLDIQKRIVQRKILEGGPDVLLTLEHPPTVTLGVRGKTTDLLISAKELGKRGVAVHHVDRGGEATFHGPGQVVCYPIVSLKALGLSARRYVQGLEETIIKTLADFDVRGFGQPRKVGVWTSPTDKIASIGVRIQRRITSHGFSLNVDLQMNPCELIVSCGMPDARMVSLNQLVPRPVTVASVRKAVSRSFADVFDVNLERGSLEQFMA
ncbi:MAG: lipoyl(octanoyl) transferase LipB, partial [Desulfomonilaceae bacterium]